MPHHKMFWGFLKAQLKEMSWAPEESHVQLPKADSTVTLPTLVTGTKDVIKNKATSTAQKLL